MKNFNDFIKEANSGCNGTKKGIKCPIHGMEICPSYKKKFSVATVHPGNFVEEETTLKEKYTQIQERGSTYSIMLSWKGKIVTLQMFFPKFTRPSKEEVTFEVRKIYPGCVVLYFKPSIKDPTKPLFFIGQENESR